MDLYQSNNNLQYYFFSFSFQSVLDIRVLHRGYTDPNNLMFTDIKVLGVPSSVSQVTVQQNGVTIASPHTVEYTASKQVR